MTPYYDDGTVTLYCADALEVLPTLPAGSVDACVTDPPYAIGFASAGRMSSKIGGWADMMNAATWFAAWYREVSRILRHTGALWTFANWRTIPVVMRAALDSGMPVTSMAVWDKEWIGPGGHQGLRPSYEVIALLAKPGFTVPDRGASDVLRHRANSTKPHGHPAEKPEALIERVLGLHALEPGQLVLDPFAGSGTTAAAARAMGIRCIAIEAEERWCEAIAARLSQDVLNLVAATEDLSTRTNPTEGTDHA